MILNVLMSGVFLLMKKVCFFHFKVKTAFYLQLGRIEVNFLRLFDDKDRAVSIIFQDMMWLLLNHKMIPWN